MHTGTDPEQRWSRAKRSPAQEHTASGHGEVSQQGELPSSTAEAHVAGHRSQIASWAPRRVRCAVGDRQRTDCRQSRVHVSYDHAGSISLGIHCQAWLGHSPRSCIGKGCAHGCACRAPHARVGTSRHWMRSGDPRSPAWS